MNELRNKVNLIGRLGADPEVKKLDDGTVVANFSVGINENYKDKAGEWQEKTSWHRIVAWGKTGELVEKLLVKGTEVILEGSLQNQSWEDKEGVKQYRTEVKLSEFLVLNNKKE